MPSKQYLEGRAQVLIELAQRADRRKTKNADSMESERRFNPLFFNLRYPAVMLVILLLGDHIFRPTPEAHLNDKIVSKNNNSNVSSQRNPDDKDAEWRIESAKMYEKYKEEQRAVYLQDQSLRKQHWQDDKGKTKQCAGKHGSLFSCSPGESKKLNPPSKYAGSPGISRRNGGYH